MLDTIIYEKLHVYQLRIDLPPDFKTKEFLDKFLIWIYKLENMNSNNLHYLGKMEVSEQGKSHFQGILHVPKKLNANQLTKLRQYCKKVASKTKQPVSITDAKKLGSLMAYVGKSSSEYITTWSADKLELIPKWIPKVASLKALFLKKLDDRVKEFQCQSAEFSPTLLMSQERFFVALQCSYREVYDRPCLHKNTIITLLYKYNYFNNFDIKSYLFPFGILPAH